jgi:DNA-binding PucR family transcriptional regulator
VVGWVPEPTQGGKGLVRLDRLGQALAADLSCTGRPLFVPCDESLAWFWLPFNTRPELDWACMALTLEANDPTIRIAVGELERGVEGFRSTHYQAVGAQNVAGVAEPPGRITFAARVGPIALMCRDIEATRVWVRKVLGPLATDKDNHQTLRETLRVFLEHHRSYSGAAETLNLHRNTVHYRLNKAAELLPNPITERTSDLELALRACHQLGSVLLLRDGEQRR